MRYYNLSIFAKLRSIIIVIAKLLIRAVIKIIFDLKALEVNA